VLGCSACGGYNALARERLADGKVPEALGSVNTVPILPRRQCS
jgi:hypothetical protein